MIISKASRLQTLKTYYFATKLQEVRKMQAEGKAVLNLGIGSPDLTPPQAAIDTLIQAAQNPHYHAYQPYKSIAPLRQEMVNFYQKTYQIALNPDTEILPLIGSKEGITHISLAFLDPDDEVLIPELGYPAYAAVSQMVGAKIRPYALKEAQNWQPDISNLQNQNLEKVKLMWLNYPHMPTGSSAALETFEKLVTLAQEKQFLLCHDNPYSLVLPQKEPISIFNVPQAKEVAIELNSMSKSHNMAGWRIGWLGGAKAYIDAVLAIKSNVDSGMFRPLQEAAIEALKMPASWHQERNAIYLERREIVFQIMDRLHCHYNPQQVGMFVWARLPENISDSQDLVDELLYKKYLFITPGFIFGEKGRPYIRISLCNPVSVLKEALERI